jgi:hypothetical protein
MLAEAGTPVVVHAGSGPVANGFTGPEPFGAVLARHPRLTVVIAHLGAPEYEGFFALADRYDRVFLDTTMAFTGFSGGMGVFPARLLPHLRDLGLAGRVLLGSDFPNIPYEYAEQLLVLADLGFGDQWLREVCWNAAARLAHSTVEAGHEVHVHWSGVWGSQASVTVPRETPSAAASTRWDGRTARSARTPTVSSLPIEPARACGRAVSDLVHSPSSLESVAASTRPPLATPSF